MPVNTLTDTKVKILKAAREEFMTHGYEGARLQSIADQTGVTKAMIHYYFNTKKELFERVFNQSVNEVFNNLSPILEKNISLFEKIEAMVNECLQKTEEETEPLSFVIIESSRKPDWLISLFDEQLNLNLKPLEKQLQKAASNYEIASVEASQLLLNIFALCFYPAVASPINESLLGNGHKTNGHRKGIILDIILNWLTA